LVEIFEGIEKFKANGQNRDFSSTQSRDNQDLFIYFLIKSLQTQSKLVMHNPGKSDENEDILGIYAGHHYKEVEVENISKHFMYGNAVEKGNFTMASYWRSRPDYNTVKMNVYTIIMASNLGLWIFQYDFKKGLLKDKVSQIVAFPLPYDFLETPIGFTPIMNESGQLKDMYFEFGCVGRRDRFIGYLPYPEGAELQKVIASELGIELN
jgi:hypothetical protein